MAREIKVSTCFSKLPHAVKTVQGNEKANFRLHDLIINDAPLDVSTSNWFFTRNIFPIVFFTRKKKKNYRYPNFLSNFLSRYISQLEYNMSCFFNFLETQSARVPV